MIFDVLSSNNTVVGDADFTAAAAPPLQVALNPIAAAGLVFSDANGNTWVEPGDRLILSRLLVNTPFCFGQGTGTHRLGIAWKNSIGGFVIIPEFAGNSTLTVPTLEGIDFAGGPNAGGGLFIKTPTNLGKLQLALTVATLNVSMVNLPTDLVGQVIALQYHLEVFHTLPLAAVP